MKDALLILGIACLLFACDRERSAGVSYDAVPQDTLTFRTELDSARDLLRKRSIDDAEEIAARVLIASAGRQELARQHMQALSVLGQVQQSRAQLESAMALYRDLLHMAEEMRDTFWIGAGWVNIGVVHELQGNYPASLEAGLTALHWKELHGDSASLARVLHNLSVLQWRQDNVGRAIDLIERSITIKRTHDPLGVPSSLAGLGLLLIEAEHYDTAILVLKESVVLEDGLADGAERENAITNIALAFEYMGLLDSAAHYHAMALRDARAHANGEVAMHSLHGLGEVRRTQGRFAEARLLLDSSLALAGRIGAPEGIKQAHASLVELHEEMGNAQAALQHLLAYHALNDSLTHFGTQAAMEELLLRYDSEKKDRENAELRAQQELAELRADRNSAIAIGTGMLALALAALGWTMLQRHRQRARQREAELEQQALRLQMDPHFLFNALNTIPGLYASGDPATANDHVGHLSKFLRLVLETSRRRTIPLAQEIELVEHYLRICANRRPDKFTWELKVMPYVRPERLGVPPMLIQPVVENALEHGFNGMAKGHLSVLVDLAGSVLHVEVMDNGIGHKAAAQRPSRRNGNSMGIDLVRQRIMLFDKQANLNDAVHLRDGSSGDPSRPGTTVTLRFRPQQLTEHAEARDRG